MDFKTAETKLADIKREVSFWKIKEQLTPEESLELNNTFELHWKCVDLLIRKLEKEEQHRKEKFNLIEEYWGLIRNREERRKSLITEQTETKFVNVRINKNLRDKFRNFLKENFLSSQNTFITSLIFNQAFQAYQNKMFSNVDLNSNLEDKKELCHVGLSLNLNNHKIYKTLTGKGKHNSVSAIFNAYLEYLAGKHLSLTLDVK